MPEINENTVPSAASTPTPFKDATENPNECPVGILAPFPYSPEPFANLTPAAKAALMGLDNIATKTDVAARRLEIEQAWEAIHFDRGYQHLLRARQGGWQLPGNGTGFGPNQQQNNSAIYETNVYGPKGDIIVAALSREIPKQEFFPVNPEYSPDIIAAEEADRFKLIWQRNVNMHALLVDCARIFWNEDRALLWTRYELNGQQYGFEEEVPEAEELFDADGAPTGQEGQEDLLDAIISPEEGEVPEKDQEEPPEDGTANTIENSTSSRKPLGKEITTCHGKIDHKCPIAVDNLQDMPWVQLRFEVDVAVARATFPWIADKIKVGSDGNSEAQLDRIARENVRQAVIGAFVTGDSLARHTTIGYTWFRPSFFLDDSITDAVKAELLEEFPDGCLLAKAGPEFAFARNENMDDHLVIGHPWPGKGQNRRAMGQALIALQKRINDWVDLMDDFFKRTVPKKWYNSDAFDVEALAKQPNMPGSSGPFLPQPGLTARDQYIMVEDTPQPQAALPDFIKWFVSGLSEEISGAMPSLFGAATNTDTVGGIEIQRDQALQRVGCPWNNVQDMFADAARQAVKCAKECREGKQISQNIPNVGNVTVNTSNLAAGNVLCYAESNPALPESWEQRQNRLMEMVQESTNNPGIAQWLFSPSNLPILADGIRMKQFKVPGATSVTKQKAEFEALLREAPVDNPKLLELKNTLQQSLEGIQQDETQGKEIPPEAQQVIEVLTQQVQQLQNSQPKMSSVPIAQDESELHAVEADTCFQWMNSAEGQKFKHGTPAQKASFENVYLHWKEHTAMAKKIAAENAPPQKPPSESISTTVDKLPVNAAIQALAKLGITATPEDFAQHAKDQLQQKVAQKTIPDALKNK